jgi:Polyketide cyclase / dehydrase and lipid transport
MVRNSNSIEIKKPSSEVFAFVTEFPNDPSWQRGKKSCTWTSEGGLKVGATYRQHARFLGRDVYQNFTVLEVDAPRRVRYESKDGSFPLTVTRTVEDLDATRCRFTETVEGEPGRFFSMAAPLLQPVVKRTITRDFEVLKKLLELS